MVVHSSFDVSIIKFVELDLHLLKLFEELLQLHFREYYFLALVDIRRGKLFKLSMLDVFTVFSCLFICLEVEGELKLWRSDVSGEYGLLTRCRVVEHRIPRLHDMALVKWHVESPVEVLKHRIRRDDLSLHGQLGGLLLMCCINHIAIKDI